MADLTVYIPAYERPHTLGRLLASIPDRSEIKVVVSDDSPHGTSRIPAENFPHVEYTQRNYRLGRDGNVLRGIAVCDTPWLIIAGDDDWFLPDAFDVILPELAGQADRLILASEAALPYIPTGVLGKVLTDAQFINTIRDNPSLLVATTLCTSNIYRTDTLDLTEGVRRLDTHYSYSWSTLDAQWWKVIDQPLIGVGTEMSPIIEDPLVRWQEYLDGLTEHAGVDPIDIDDACRWNFNYVETR